MSSELEIEEVISEEKTTKAPKLYDLTNLQRAANKKFGLSAKQTLDIAQSLYEAKYISYPRTDSEYITSDMVESVRQLIGSHVDSDMFDNVEKIANNKKVSDHTALLPTIYSIDKKDEINNLDKNHINIYTLIYMQLLKAVSKNYRYMQTKIKAISGDIDLYTVGKVDIDQGFKKLESKDNAAKDESMKAEETIIGTCPYCQGNVYINDRSINCENSKYGNNKGNCRLSTLRIISGHKLDEDEAKSLIENGKTPLITDFKSKKGNKFPAYVILASNGAYPTTLEFPDKKS